MVDELKTLEESLDSTINNLKELFIKELGKMFEERTFTKPLADSIAGVKKEALKNFNKELDGVVKNYKELPLPKFKEVVQEIFNYNKKQVEDNIKKILEHEKHIEAQQKEEQKNVDTNVKQIDELTKTIETPSTSTQEKVTAEKVPTAPPPKTETFITKKELRVALEKVEKDLKAFEKRVSAHLSSLESRISEVSKAKKKEPKVVDEEKQEAKQEESETQKNEEKSEDVQSDMKDTAAEAKDAEEEAESSANEVDVEKNLEKGYEKESSTWKELFKKFAYGASFIIGTQLINGVQAAIRWIRGDDDEATKDVDKTLTADATKATTTLTQDADAIVGSAKEIKEYTTATKANIVAATKPTEEKIPVGDVETPISKLTDNLEDEANKVFDELDKEEPSKKTTPTDTVEDTKSKTEEEEKKKEKDENRQKEEESVKEKEEEKKGEKTIEGETKKANAAIVAQTKGDDKALEKKAVEQIKQATSKPTPETKEPLPLPKNEAPTKKKEEEKKEKPTSIQEAKLAEEKKKKTIAVAGLSEEAKKFEEARTRKQLAEKDVEAKEISAASSVGAGLSLKLRKELEKDPKRVAEIKKKREDALKESKQKAEQEKEEARKAATLLLEKAQKKREEFQKALAEGQKNPKKETVIIQNDTKLSTTEVEEMIMNLTSIIDELAEISKKKT